MNNLFFTFVSLSVSASIIGLVIYVLSKVTKLKFGGAWKYYIWLVVIARLLIPFSPSINLSGGLIQQTADAFMESAFISEPSNAAIINEESPNVNSGAEAAPVKNNMPLTMYIGAAWLAVAAVLLLSKIASNGRIVRKIKKSSAKLTDTAALGLFDELCAEMAIRRRPGIFINKHIPSPMLIGALRPFIVISDEKMSAEELRLVLKHELTHYKRLDVLYKWAVQFAVCMHWFNPIVYFIGREINRKCELSCDEAVVKKEQKTERCIYGNALLSAIKPVKTIRYGAALSPNGDVKLLKERLDIIMSNKKKSKMTYFVSALLAVFLLVGTLFTGVYAADAKAQDVNNTVAAVIATAAEAVLPTATPAAATQSDTSADTSSGVKNVNFKSVPTKFSTQGFFNSNDGSPDCWSMSFAGLNGETACEATKVNNYPQSLAFSSAVGSGEMRMQIEQGDKVVEVPLGEQTVSLDGFNDGTITVRVIADNARNGHMSVTAQ